MYKCLCCGNETLPVPTEEAIAYICPVCWWENDVFLKSPDEPSDETAKPRADCSPLNMSCWQGSMIHPNRHSVLRGLPVMPKQKSI